MIIIKNATDKNALSQSRKEWAEKKTINSAINFLGRFEGNPVSSLLNLYCEGKAEENLLKKPDLFNWDSALVCKLPCEGRVPAILTDNIHGMVYNFPLRIFARKGQLNGGSFAHFIEEPSLDHTGNPCYSINMRIPLAEGYYTNRWQLNKSRESAQNVSGTVFVCKEIDTSNNRITFGTIPYIINDPVSSLDYHLIIMSNISGCDSLILTYVMINLDRSQSVSFRTIYYENSRLVGTDKHKGDGFELYLKMDQYIRSKERLIISQENLQSDDKLLGLYIFVYSVNRKESIGAGSIWMQ